jgi:hypothetical protein
LAKQHYDPEKIKLTIIYYNIENNPSAKESIESLLSQTYANFDFIILIKNDFDSQKIAKTFKRKDFRVSIAENNHEVTFLDALILAKSIKKGKYITFSDCNGKLTKESLDKQINFLENNNKYKMSCINVKKRDSYYTRDLYIADTVPLEWQAVWGVPIAGKNTVYRKEIFNNTTIPNKHTNNDLIYYDFLTNILTKHKSYLLEDEWYKYYARSDIQEKDINIFRMINENYLKNFFNIREIKNITQFISFSKTKDTKNFNCLNFLNWMYSLKDKMDQKYLFSKAELEQITTNIQDRLIDIISIPLIKEINKKNIIIKNQEQQIKKYQNSRSWKITKPLRKITSLWKKLSRIFN